MQNKEYLYKKYNASKTEEEEKIWLLALKKLHGSRLEFVDVDEEQRQIWVEDFTKRHELLESYNPERYGNLTISMHIVACLFCLGLIIAGGIMWPISWPLALFGFFMWGIPAFLASSWTLINRLVKAVDIVWNKLDLQKEKAELQELDANKIYERKIKNLLQSEHFLEIACSYSRNPYLLTAIVEKNIVGSVVVKNECRISNEDRGLMDKNSKINSFFRSQIAFYPVLRQELNTDISRLIFMSLYAVFDVSFEDVAKKFYDTFVFISRSLSFSPVKTSAMEENLTGLENSGDEDDYSLPLNITGPK